jgi:glutamine amidotransferase
MIAIIDYGVGNIKAFSNIYKQLGLEVKVARKASDLQGASKLILPGVGHYDYAMQKFTDSGMRDIAHSMVVNEKIPVIGICVGMQMLAKSSDEGKLPGLCWIDATVKKFDASLLNQKTRLPHMGWNDVLPVSNNPLLVGLESDARFYFLHSYYFDCHNPKDTIATANYGIEFSCIVNHENIFGVQCHPEKSHHFGIQLLKNFATL